MTTLMRQAQYNIALYYAKENSVILGESEDFVILSLSEESHSLRSIDASLRSA